MYSKDGLRIHPKKRVRRAVVFKAWGAEVEGDIGLVGPYRQRLHDLQVLTCLAVRRRIFTMEVFDSVLGCWSFCCQFRRPLYAMLDHVYRVDFPPSKAFRLDRHASNELLVLSISGSLSISDIRAKFDPYIYCTGA